MFQAAAPDGQVLSRETGHQRDYGRNPYPGYDNVSDRPWMFRGPIDDRLPPMEKVVGVQIGKEAKAYSHAITRKRGVIEDRIDGTDVVIFHTADGATSALDGERIATSRVSGSTGVFRRSSDGQTLSFVVTGGTFTDKQTGSTWDVTGQAVAGPLEGTRLSPVPHVDAFAFAWLAMTPQTKIYR
ncbi:MAG: hypothetical protein ACI9W4_001789 [Rhodothermales bacterium]|jgi:hypothetical protein